ncbi:MAG: hypothetical protein NTV93_03910 [Verrucomicrobia bacterium]|nr:hypothetical protein [Verrucomicrobiota bacterium]
MEQVVIIVVIGLISLVNWLMKRSAEIRAERRLERQRLGIPEGDPYHEGSRKAGTPADPSPPAMTPSADMRRLMEALGLPAGEEEDVPESAPDLPPLPAFHPPTPPKLRAGKIKDPGFAPPPAPPASPLALALHSHEGIRQAIVLREILGPPKALTI